MANHPKISWLQTTTRHVLPFTGVVHQSFTRSTVEMSCLCFLTPGASAGKTEGDSAARGNSCSIPLAQVGLSPTTPMGAPPSGCLRFLTACWLHSKGKCPKTLRKQLCFQDTVLEFSQHHSHHHHKFLLTQRSNIDSTARFLPMETVSSWMQAITTGNWCHNPQGTSIMIPN